MRILHFGPPVENGPFNLLTGFRNLGHIVETCNIISVIALKEKAEKAIKQFKPDMIITIGGWHAYFDAKTLWQIISDYKIPHIYWAIEDPTYFDWASSIHINAYDFVFTVSEECVPRYTDLGVPAAYLSYACNPDLHKRTTPDEKYKNDIIVLSNKYTEYDPERCAFRNQCYHNLIEPVLEGGYDIMIYGLRWDDGKYQIPAKNRGGYISRKIVSTVYSSAKIVLIIQWDLTGHICFKTYEAFGCRCFQLAPYTPLQEKYFKDGEHIVYSHSPEETIKYVDYYLSHDEERELIAKKGQEEVYKNHNCTLRAREALRKLKSHGFNIDYIEK